MCGFPKYRQMKDGDSIDEAFQGAEKLRHLELHAFAIRDLIREEQVRLQWVDTKSNPADLLTKAVPSKALFDKFAKLIMGAVDDTAKVFLLSLRSVLVKGRRRMWH